MYGRGGRKFSVSRTIGICIILSNADDPEISRLSSIFFIATNRTNRPTFTSTRPACRLNFGLSRLALARDRGFSPRELRQMEKFVVERKKEFLEAWNEYFNISDSFVSRDR